MEQEKLEQMEQIFNSLNEENQSILIMVANRYEFSTKSRKKVRYNR